MQIERGQLIAMGHDPFDAGQSRQQRDERALHFEHDAMAGSGGQGAVTATGDTEIRP